MRITNIESNTIFILNIDQEMNEILQYCMIINFLFSKSLT